MHTTGTSGRQTRMKVSAPRTDRAARLDAPRSTYGRDNPLLRRRRATACGFLFLDPLSIEGAGHPLVAFVTGVLADLVLRRLHEQRRGPAPRTSPGRFH